MSQVLYTYETINGQLVCHAYTTDAEGVPLTVESATAIGQRLAAAASAAGGTLGRMVLPAEAAPA